MTDPSEGIKRNELVLGCVLCALWLTPVVHVKRILENVLCILRRKTFLRSCFSSLRNRLWLLLGNVIKRRSPRRSVLIKSLFLWQGFSAASRNQQIGGEDRFENFIWRHLDVALRCHCKGDFYIHVFFLLLAFRAEPLFKASKQDTTIYLHCACTKQSRVFSTTSDIYAEIFMWFYSIICKLDMMQSKAINQTSCKLNPIAHMIWHFLWFPLIALFTVWLTKMKQ